MTLSTRDTPRALAVAPDARGHGVRAVVAAAGAAAVALTGIALAAPATAATDPDLGPNVTFIDESWSVDEINTYLASINDEAEFSQDRHAVFFEPGVYGSAAGQDDPTTATGIVNQEIGYYTAIAGLGAQPGDVLINGALSVQPVVSCPNSPWACQDPGSLTRFWRSLSNVAINPIQRPVDEDVTRPFPAGSTAPHQMRFAVSQAAPMRRVDIRGDLTVFGAYGEYASGGYLANSRVGGTLVTGSQQQWFTRNSEVGTWDGGVWNMVFAGVEGAPATDFGPKTDGTVGVKTTLDETPVSREAPFLFRDGEDLAVFVPNAHTDTRGVDWSTDAGSGTTHGLDEFYVAHEGDTAAEINAALAGGKNLLLTPGVYALDEAIHVDNPDTVVLGLGYASLAPQTGDAALEVGDVAGVKIAGITVDAGPVSSDVLVRVGPADSHESDASDPTTLTDVFVRIGGPWVGKAGTSIEVNSDDVLLDHIWAWRADHGNGVGWDVNTGARGVVVNGDDVTATGLFVEHYQENQTVWNGERGQTVFYQSEIPYDPPSQAAFMDGDRNGWASYRVGDDVQEHQATGLGVYSFFNQGVDVRVDSAIQTPVRAGVQFRSMTSVFLNGSGGVNHVVNETGEPAVGSFASPQVVAFPTDLPDDRPTVDAQATTRCLAGKAYVAVRAQNTSDVPVDITLSTPFGSRTVAAVAPGGNAYQSFAARTTAVDAGTAGVSATGDLGSGPVTADVDAEFAATSCG
ncbi:adenylyl cyclase [Cellulosimicrobium arenosum]|uniref:adenylyl cyclase n=1 Tax=Cellulosimicrobium arenosum TaxID=2708133 RepID=UPI001F510B3E|nr:adenylyl cyclase [Cellulosimicrobium arenosum]